MVQWFGEQKFIQLIRNIKAKRNSELGSVKLFIICYWMKVHNLLLQEINFIIAGSLISSNKILTQILIGMDFISAYHMALLSTCPLYAYAVK